MKKTKAENKGQICITFYGLIFGVLGFVCTDAKAADRAHVHGSGHVEIAFEGAKGEIELDAPAMDFMGFEHQPKTAKEKKQKSDTAKLIEEKFSEAIQFDPAYGCVWKKRTVKFDYEKKAGAPHADVEAEFKIECSKPIKSSKVTFDFQKHFPGVKTMKVDFVVDDVQKSETMTGPKEVTLSVP